MLQRILVKQISKRLHKGKAVLLFGARQVGKTTLIEQLLDHENMSVLHISGDEPDIRENFKSITSSQIKSFVGNHKILFIDEAQRIDNIGITLKLITDKLKNIQVIATGSSTFEMANSTNEPLTGRKFEYTLFPLSFQELVEEFGLLEEKRQLENRLIYGSYPEIVFSEFDKEMLLKLIADSYLYKDILMLDTIKRPKLLHNILKALAFQVGSEVSFNEVAQLVGADKGTIEKYIHLLEQTFVLFTIPSYSRNARNELKKSKKIYFYDCGIRNAIIGNFSSINSRVDTGALWENYLISERVKQKEFEKSNTEFFFWRTTAQQEIDLIEITGDKIQAIEFKWNPNAKLKISKTFTKAYPDAKAQLVNPSNYHELLIS